MPQLPNQQDETRAVAQAALRLVTTLLVDLDRLAEKQGVETPSERIAGEAGLADPLFNAPSGDVLVIRERATDIINGALDLAAIARQLRAGA
ncbi:hypothetical protein [Caulobacter sp. DWP3-1-3b2]|uniref:hypothetical protein n=1 Tax=Caulobacter sp. DWP3-1-3b2 TaxID=2804643 RepID=UPI003CF7E60D